MSFVHEIIKITYVREGYLPNYPYHLISDEEMINAFIYNDINYFDSNYPCLYESLQDKYTELKNFILNIVAEYIKAPRTYIIPDWVYSYMLGAVIGPYSDLLDRHDLLVLMDMDNIADVYTEQAQAHTYAISTAWIQKLPLEYRRPATIFGNPM